MQGDLQNSTLVSMYPECFEEGMSVIYAKLSEEFQAPEVRAQFTPLDYGSVELNSLETGDVVWIPREICPDIAGFTKWAVNRVTRLSREVRIYYGVDYLKTISADTPQNPAYIVKDESLLLELVRQFGKKAVGWKFS